MEELIKSSNEIIKGKIFEIRGEQVILDSDLALFYQCSNGTKTINQAVKRHNNKFPERFCFQLTDEEVIFLRSQKGDFFIKHDGKNACNITGSKEVLRSQVGTLNRSLDLRGQHIKYNPYAFTEQGVAMLATVIRTPVADEISIAIMDAFVSMRRYLSRGFLDTRLLNNQVIKNTQDIKALKDSFKQFEEKRIVNEIYFAGQIYDAYSKILDIFCNAKDNLIIIDRYSDKKIMDIISHLKCNVVLITQKSYQLTKLYAEYNKQYHNLRIVYDNTFHDRYFILDNQEFYHCGASINQAGSRTFSINVLEDKIVKESLLDRVNKLIG